MRISRLEFRTLEKKESAMHGKVGRQRKALAKRNPCGKVKQSRSEDGELRRSPAFQRRVMDIVTEAVKLVRNPDTGSQVGLKAG